MHKVTTERKRREKEREQLDNCIVSAAYEDFLGAVNSITFPHFHWENGRKTFVTQRARNLHIYTHDIIIII